MCHWNTSCSRNADGRTNAWHDIKRNVGIDEGLGLFSPTTKHIRIATLQAHNVETLRTQVHQQRVDHFLWSGKTRLFADVNELNIGTSQIQNCLICQSIVHDDISFSNQSRRTNREQFGVTGTSTY